MRKLFIYLAVTLMAAGVFTGCGPSAEEIKAQLEKQKQAEQAKNDSIAKVVEAKLKREAFVKDSTGQKEKFVQDSTTHAKQDAAALQQKYETIGRYLDHTLAEYTTELRIAKEKMKDIKEFRLLRSSDDKQRQIENQLRKIQTIEEAIHAVEEEQQKLASREINLDNYESLFGNFAQK